MEIVIIVINTVLAVAILAHWILVLIGVLSVEDDIPGHKTWSYSFILPDLWLLVFSVLTIVTLLLNSGISVLFGFIIGVSSIMNGLFVLSYGIVAKRLVRDMPLVFMSAYTIITGGIQVFYFWGMH